MKKLTLQEWEQRYVIGRVEPFDQKYAMFARPDWDMDLRAQLGDWSESKKGGGCTLCISTCPYNKRDSWPHRAVRWFTDHVREFDRFYVKMDDVFGYGRPRKPDGFWEEWQPK